MITSLKQRVCAYRSEKAGFFSGEKSGAAIYTTYFFRGKEKLLYLTVSFGIILFISFFFYRSLWALLLTWPVGIGSYLSFQRERGEKRRRQLAVEFKDCIMSVAANLRAGYSVENAFIECMQDMRALYGEKGLMLGELYRMKRGFYNNQTLEKMLRDFGERSGSEEIKDFGEVLAIARSSGGNLPEIIRSTADLIGEKIALKQELQVLISGRLFEQKIMNVIPFFITGYIELGNRGFFNVLYHNLTGVCIMTGCLFIYLTAYILAGKICRAVV